MIGIMGNDFFGKRIVNILNEKNNYELQLGSEIENKKPFILLSII